MRVFGLIIYFLILIAFVVFAVLFAKENAYTVIVTFIGKEVPAIPLWMALFGCFFIGALCSVILLSFEIFRLKISKYKYKKSFEDIKNQLLKAQINKSGGEPVE